MPGRALFSLQSEHRLRQRTAEQRLIEIIRRPLQLSIYVEWIDCFAFHPYNVSYETINVNVETQGVRVDYVSGVGLGQGIPSGLSVGSWRDESAARHYRFADFFAGLGGFHVGLSKLGHECVFACELDDDLREVYQQNFGIRPEGDIRSVRESDVPPHDILCAGFPCQPFSLAGKKKGAACPSSGKLIDDVFRIVKYRQPRYVLLENVPNVLTIADGTFWQHIQTSFDALGYEVQHRIYSPLQFGLPQQRNRLFVVASRCGMEHFDWPDPTDIDVKPLWQLVLESTADSRLIEPAKLTTLEKWNELLPELDGLSSHTLIASEFGATYPLDGLSPGRPWRSLHGSFGVPLGGLPDRETAIQALPHYAANNVNGKPPEWMRKSILYSRTVYQKNPEFFDEWKKGMVKLPNSWHKLEWRGDRAQRNIWKQTIQFRASGIRIMRPEMAPSLVAMTPTQTPIIGSARRYLGVKEAASLQALDCLRAFPANQARAFKALGNAVNARIVYEIAHNLLSK